MKPTRIVFISTLIFIAAFFSSCKKENIAPPDTSLTIIVSDELGNIVPGATVTLYTSLTSNDGIPQISDSKGMVTFKELSPIVYYWSATLGCKTNLSSSISTVSPIYKNTDNQFGTIIKGTGGINFTNHSSNPYRVYVNGNVVFDSMNGNSVKTNYLATEGNYSIRVLQLSGFLLTPTDETFTGNVVCGGTLTVAFP
jgi:hypothetical protein